MNKLSGKIGAKIFMDNKWNSFQSDYPHFPTDEDRFRYAIQVVLDHEIQIDTPSLYTNVKSASTSKTFRDEGNRLFTLSSLIPQLDESVLQYTMSIIHAPNNSEALALGYANRSAALFKARLYEDCLLDIYRALDLPYPDNLRCKLYARQARCLLASSTTSKAQEVELEESLKNARFWLDKMDPSNPGKALVERTLKDPKKMKPVEEPFVKWNAEKSIPKLTGKESKEIPGVSDALELGYSEKYGKHRDVIVYL